MKRPIHLILKFILLTGISFFLTGAVLTANPQIQARAAILKDNAAKSTPHPRLLLNGEKISQLRSGIQTTHHFL